MKAHIIIEPDVEVGTKTLAACGKKHKVKVLWDDVPDDATICRACIDVLLVAVNEANAQMDEVARVATKSYTSAAALFDLTGQANTMTRLIDDASEYADERREKEVQKETEQARESAKTCTCYWTDSEGRILRKGCAVHDSDPLETRASTSDKAEEGDEE